MKQTAVEWFFKALIENQDKTYKQIELILEQAKEMEKEQIKFFFDKGHLYSGCPYGFEEAYLKTFKSE